MRSGRGVVFVFVVVGRPRVIRRCAVVVASLVASLVGRREYEVVGGDGDVHPRFFYPIADVAIGTVHMFFL